MTNPARNAGPSRAVIESLCVLYVVGEGARSAGDVAERLGLAREMAPAIEEGLKPLVEVGYLEVRETLVSLTDAGRAWLRGRLAEFEWG